MNSLKFTKYTAAGNDFIIIDAKPEIHKIINQDFIKKICDRHLGIGADGLMIIDHSNKNDFDLTYFNSDGSSGMLCGNGSRCAIHYANLIGISKKHSVNFKLNDTIYSGSLEKEIVTINLSKPSEIDLDNLIELNDYKIKYHSINTGSPHVVIFIDDIKNKYGDRYFNSLKEIPVNELSRKIRYNNLFDPVGTNVNYISIENNIINIRTYEKGIEGETLACGTGAVASALISHYTNSFNSPIMLKTKRGYNLEVGFTKNENRISDVYLKGNVEKIFEGEYII